MKRSEMIAKLKFWIDDNTWANDDKGVSDYARDHTEEELKKLADALMDFIEDAGMLPPPKHPNIYADISNWESYLVWEDEDSINRFIWDQEDEKK